MGKAYKVVLDHRRVTEVCFGHACVRAITASLEKL